MIISRLIVLFIKCKQIEKNAHYMMSSNSLFYPIISPQLKDVPFIIIYDGEKQQILPFQRLELEDFCKLNIKIVQVNLSTYRLIN